MQENYEVRCRKTTKLVHQHQILANDPTDLPLFFHPNQTICARTTHSLRHTTTLISVSEFRAEAKAERASLLRGVRSIPPRTPRRTGVPFQHHNRYYEPSAPHTTPRWVCVRRIRFNRPACVYMCIMCTFVMYLRTYIT